MNQKKLSSKNGPNSQNTNKPRLIDANEFYKNYCDMFEKSVDDSEMDRMAYAISRQPTAYDITKITEMEDEIKELKVITGLMQKRTYYRKFIDEV